VVEANDAAGSVGGDQNRVQETSQNKGNVQVRLSRCLFPSQTPEVGGTVTTEGQRFFLGVYDTEEEAIEVRQEIENKASIAKAAEKRAAQRRKKRRLIKHKNNTTGQRGVSHSKAGYFRARIIVDGERIALGTFDAVADVAKAYREAERNLMH
jgi:hypothetical protein